MGLFTLWGQVAKFAHGFGEISETNVGLPLDEDGVVVALDAAEKDDPVVGAEDVVRVGEHHLNVAAPPVARACAVQLHAHHPPAPPARARPGVPRTASG